MIPHSSSSVRPADLAYIADVAGSNFVGQGELCHGFEARLRKVCQRKTSVLTDSGSAALELGLRVLRKRWPRRRYVAVSAYVCPAVVSAIVREGLKPLFIDVRADSMNIDAAALKQRIDDQTLAIIFTNIGGIPDDYACASALPCALISDCAQGIGAAWMGRPLTSLGQLAILSFGPTKMLTAGSGGALLIDDSTLSALATTYSKQELDIADYRQNGFQPTYGQHFSDLNAGLGLAQLSRLNNFIKQRQKIAATYTDVLHVHAGITLPQPADAAVSNSYRYYFLTDTANAWLKHLRNSGIDARSSISHDMSSYYKGIGVLPNLTHNANRLVSLPIYPGLRRSEVLNIVQALRQGIETGLQ